MTCMPKLISRCATSVPIRPKPRMPATLPLSSTPVNFDRFHSPALSDAAACGTLRATASSSAVACSAALTMLELGAFHHHARLGGRGHVDVVQADSCPGDDPQGGGMRQRLGVY